MHIQTKAYEGPFDLLLNLIAKNEIDIYDIPIAELTQKYLEAISAELPPDMDGMSEFLVMAATLLEIKSRMLLPRPKHSEDAEEDPREALVRQLIAYKHCQDLAEVLKNVPSTGQRYFKQPEQPLMSRFTKLTPDEWLEDTTYNKLLEIFTDVMRRKALKVNTRALGTIKRDEHTTEEKIRYITSRLQQGKLKLSQLFEECKSREECVVTFLALLEMIKLSRAIVRQDQLFGEIEVLTCRT